MAVDEANAVKVCYPSGWRDGPVTKDHVLLLPRAKLSAQQSRQVAHNQLYLQLQGEVMPSCGPCGHLHPHAQTVHSWCTSSAIK